MALGRPDSLLELRSGSFSNPMATLSTTKTRHSVAGWTQAERMDITGSARDLAEALAAAALES